MCNEVIEYIKFIYFTYILCHDYDYDNKYHLYESKEDKNEYELKLFSNDRYNEKNIVIFVDKNNYSDHMITHTVNRKQDTDDWIII